MEVEKLIRRLNGRQDAVENGRVAAVVTAELFAECAAALAKLQAERDEAREALRPFAEASRDCDDDLVSDGCSAWESSEANCVTIGHFRAASRALGGGE